jgi:hypothetical protein
MLLPCPVLAAAAMSRARCHSGAGCTPARSLSDGTSSLEPNNIVSPPEYCGLANFSMATGNDTHVAWGWSDANCDQKYTYMCKVSSECSRPPRNGAMQVPAG